MTLFQFPTLLWLAPLLAITMLVLRIALTGRIRRPGLIAQWSALNGRQRLTVFVVIAVFIGLLFIARSITLTGRETILRQQFHIPETASLEHFSTQTKMRRRPRIEALVRFDDASYDSYAASLGNAALWSPVPFVYGSDGDMTPAARGSGFMWYPLPYPGWAGEVTLRWGSSAMDEAQYVRNGRYFCTAVMVANGATPDAAKRYTAKACRSVTRSEKNVAAIMLGVLDADTKSLYATIY